MFATPRGRSARQFARPWARGSTSSLVSLASLAKSHRERGTRKYCPTRSGRTDTDRLWRAKALQLSDRLRPQHRRRTEHFDADYAAVLTDIEDKLAREVIRSRSNLPPRTTRLDGRDQPQVRGVNFWVVGALHRVSVAHLRVAERQFGSAF